MSQECLDAASKLLDSVMAGDMGAALGTLHAENVVHEPASLWYGGDWKGPGGFAEILGLMTSKLDLKVNSYVVLDGGDHAVMKAEVTFTSKASGRTLDMPVVELYRSRDGQLVDMDIFYKDTAAVLELANETATTLQPSTAAR
jgi:ketosteroid isomerase-like protein